MSELALRKQVEVDRTSNDGAALVVNDDEYVDLVVKRAIGRDVGTLLDVGAGRGRYTYLVRATSYAVNEPHTPTWEAGAWLPNTARVEGDLYGLKAPNQAFDMVTCYHVLHHLADRLRAMREMARVLRPRGRLLIVEPRHTWKRAARVLHSWATDYVWRHRRIYPTHDFLTPAELPALCRRVGLRVMIAWTFSARVAILAERP